jgi:hypothetical protein
MKVAVFVSIRSFELCREDDAWPSTPRFFGALTSPFALAALPASPMHCELPLNFANLERNRAIFPGIAASAEMLKQAIERNSADRRRQPGEVEREAWVTNKRKRSDVPLIGEARGNATWLRCLRARCGPLTADRPFTESAGALRAVGRDEPNGAP